MTSKSVKIEPLLAEALQKVAYPGFDGDIISLGLVTEARLEQGGQAVVKMRPLAAPDQVREELENAVAQALLQVPGVRELALELPQPPSPKAHKGPLALPGVKAVVPVASGKGGVGKSTVAVNLALALRDLGMRVGLLDLDLYGPSLPIMLGLQDAQPQPAADGKRIAPVESHGLKVLSIGFMISSEKALIWRGPLIMKAVRQLLHEVAWEPLDVLILDLPPGTGDVQITMTQEAPITGAVVVTTPQDVALVDAVKAVDMFKTTGSLVLGVVENMSYFVCPDCGGRHEIFGHGTGEALARRLGVDFLGEIPLNPRVPLLMDQGRPAVEFDPEAAGPYKQLAQRVKDKLANLEPKRKSA